MKTTFTSPTKYLLALLIIASAIASCKKSEDAKLPTIAFKAGGNYTSTDQSVTTSDIINVGITAEKNESNLKTFKIYRAVGNGAMSIKKTFYLADADRTHYEKDYEFRPENAANYETWKFEITDENGNVNSVSLKLTVQ